MSASTRSKWSLVALAVAIFALLAGLTDLALGRSLVFGLASAALTGIGVSTFETFYVQGQRGRWLRTRPPTRSLPAYLVVVVVVSVLSLIAARLLFGSPADLPRVYAHLSVSLPLCVACSVVCILVTRILRHIGAGTLAHLIMGTYSRPVLERKVLMFVDMNGSTGLAERLGAFRTQALFDKFAVDIARPIEDCGGAIHLYKGDGLVAVWDWSVAVADQTVLRAVDRMFAALAHEAAQYIGQFGIVPTFRVGIHGGDVVLSETSGLKRTIGIYGNVINIAARIEDACRVHSLPCAVSGAIARGLGVAEPCFRFIATETLRGVREPTDIYEYRVAPLERPMVKRMA